MTKLFPLGCLAVTTILTVACTDRSMPPPPNQGSPGISSSESPLDANSMNDARNTPDDLRAGNSTNTDTNTHRSGPSAYDPGEKI